MSRRTVGGLPVTRRLALGVAVVFVAVAVLVSTLRPDSESESAPAPPQPPGAVVEAPLSPEKSAAAAAAEHATLLARVFGLPTAQARQAAAEAASEAYRPALVAAVDRDLVPLQRRAATLPGQTVYRQAVLATRVDRLDEDAGGARVAVWLMSMVGQAGQQANPVASFTTVLLDLTWERSGWRLDGVAESAGPTPLLDGAPQLVDEVIAELRGFADWRPA